MMFKIRSKGADPNLDNDDTDLAVFSASITEAHRGTGFATAEVKTTVFAGAKGAISGTITDPNGAVVPNAEVIATDQADESRTFTARSDEDGKYLLANLPSGKYTLKVTAAAGF